MNTEATSNGEMFISSMQEHWIRYVGPAFGCLILTTLSIFLYYLAGVSAFEQEWASDALFVTATIMLLVTTHGIFHLLMSRYLSQIIVTDKRIIKLDQRLFLQDEMHESPLDKVRVVSAEKHGVMQSLLRYGTVVLDQQKITYVPHPHAVARDIAHVLEMK